MIAVNTISRTIWGGSDLRWNGLYSAEPAVVSFLNAAQSGGDWQSTQTVPPTGVAAGAPGAPDEEGPRQYRDADRDGDPDACEPGLPVGRRHVERQGGGEGEGDPDGDVDRRGHPEAPPQTRRHPGRGVEPTLDEDAACKLGRLAEPLGQPSLHSRGLTKPTHEAASRRSS